MKPSISVVCLWIWAVLFGPLVQAQNGAAPEAFSDFLSAYYEDWLAQNPLQATSLGDHRFDHIWPDDLSQISRAAQATFYSSYLDRLQSFDRDALSVEQRINYDMLKWDLEIGLEALSYNIHLMPINQMFSPTVQFAQLGSGNSFHPFETVENYEDFLGRMAGFETWAQTAIENMKTGIAIGYVQPQEIVRKILPQLQAMLVEDVEESLFYQPLTRFPEDMPATDRTRLTSAYRQAIEEQVLPAYRRLHDFMQGEYLSAARASHGIGSLPEGEELYAYWVKFWTPTQMTPDEIFELGEREVARIQAEMERVKEGVNFTGSLEDFFASLNSNPDLYPFESADEVLTAFKAIEGQMQPHLSKLFSLVPRTPFEVRQVEAFRAASASAHYQQGAPDGSRPGIFYVPITDARRFNKSGMESLFAHEAIPGHHYQLSLQRELESLPNFRKAGFISSFIEGWALYTESLGRELGLYSDPYQYMGRLRSELLRAVRLVVDTGLHARGWSREEAIQYMMDTLYFSRGGASNQVERYMVLPGQALAYKIGELTILGLRREAEQKLGDQFDIKAFHGQLLKNGSLPLAVLESTMRDWMEAQR